ncbi:hypothetical protein H8K47_03095 [Undibacterium sp. CY7W]|uniref:Uncharacterized protein n=1 Tax=Undibacterium rugosum TaxID=2762291 RepID=A0A923KZ32_9BURK|nr:hypothetical protein [Undibacterium rugosum]MBC3934341.1 hypothetical protein [Undibacterium rugosum]
MNRVFLKKGKKMLELDIAEIIEVSGGVTGNDGGCIPIKTPNPKKIIPDGIE